MFVTEAFLSISVAFRFLPLCTVLPTRSLTVAFKGFLIVCRTVFYTQFTGLHPLCFTVFPLSIHLRWSSDPPPSPHLLSSPVLTSLPSTRIRENLPSLLLSHPSLFVFPSPCLSFSLLKMHWQIEVRLRTAGCFNFIDPLQRWQKLRIVSACD